MTTGIVVVARRTASFSRNPVATITSTPNCTNSVAKPGTRSDLPAAKRRSVTMFLPSTHPSARIPSKNASHCGGNGCEGSVPVDRRPMRGVFGAGCASTASGSRTRLTVRMTASPISRNGHLGGGRLAGSLAEGHGSHQRPGLDEHRGAWPARAIRSRDPPHFPQAASSY